MFAVADHRILTCRGKTKDGQRFVCIIPDNQTMERETLNSLYLEKARRLPTRGRLRELARILLRARFIAGTDGRLVYVPEDHEILEIKGGEADGRQVAVVPEEHRFSDAASEITIAVWKRSYDPARRALLADKLAEETVRR